MLSNDNADACDVTLSMPGTDRDDPFFAEADNPNLVILNDVLMTWCVYNFDLGYVQGMSDLVSMILRVVKDEVSTFWCFIGMMDSPSGLNIGGAPVPTPGGMPDSAQRSVEAPT